MTAPPFRMEPLHPGHDRAAFHCGEEGLDRYFQTQATQDIRRKVANCFVATEVATGAAAGYYTLSSASIAMVDLPPAEIKRLPRYPTLSAALIGCLAVDLRFQGLGLGGALLADAARRAMKADLAAFTLLVDTKNEQAGAFYRRYGFRALASREKTMFLPISTAAAAFKQSD